VDDDRVSRRTSGREISGRTEPDRLPYQRYRADAQRFASLMVRTMGDRRRYGQASVKHAGALEPDLPLFRRADKDECSHSSDGTFRCADAMCRRSFGGSHRLVLSAVGLYAVTPPTR